MRTLSDLRTELRNRLGFGAVSANSAPMTAMLNSFLQAAQEDIYWNYSWDDLKAYWDLITVAGTKLYAYPTTTEEGLAGLVMEPRRMEGIWLIYNSAWMPLAEGIPPAYYTFPTQTYPTRFQRRQGGAASPTPFIELWPTPNAVYTVPVYGYMALQSFVNDADTATMDDRLIFLHALGHAKAHYKQSDASAYMGEWKARSSRLKAANHATKRYLARPNRPPRPMPTLDPSNPW